jgi:hypothetical protein
VMTHAEFAAWADTLPSYSEIEFEWANGNVTHLMARDIPRPGRRWTSLTSGTEVFGLAEALIDRGAVKVRIVKAEFHFRAAVDS